MAKEKEPQTLEQQARAAKEAAGLPSDKFTPKAEEPAAEAPAVPGPADKALTAALDTLIKHLLTDATHWKTGVPDVGAPWQPIFMYVLGGTRPPEGQPDLEGAREVVKPHPTLARIYAGATQRERLLVVRVVGTTYIRAEILPWTIGQ